MKRVQIAPKFQLTFETGMSFKQLSPEAKDVVYRRFHSWLCEARKRGADYWHIQPDTSSLDEDSSEILIAMAQNACDGFDSYWSRAAKDDEPSQTVSGGVRPSQAGKNKIIKKESIQQGKEEHNHSNNDLFECFWAAYPRKESKASAQAAFEQINPSADLLNKMLDAIERMKQSGIEPRFIPYPAKWLSERRWEDEPLQASNNPFLDALNRGDFNGEAQSS